MTHYLPTQTILAAELGGSVSWTTGFPEDFTGFSNAYAYYDDGVAQEIYFPSATTALGFIAAMAQIHPGRKVIRLVFDA